MADQPNITAQAEAVLLGWHDQRTCEEIKGKLHDWDGHIVELSRAVAADAYCVECGISAIDAKADIDRRDALAALVEEAKDRERALTWPDHKCEPIAVSQFLDEGRECWVGKLIEPLDGYPLETHCLHMRTPAKGRIVFGIMEGDWTEWSALFTVLNGGPIGQTWLENKAVDYQNNVAEVRQWLYESEDELYGAAAQSEEEGTVP
jgi:hypothetical protein